MSKMSQVLCIGSVLWDVIGRAEIEMPLGADRPGRITRLPGGVALNIAMALARFDISVTLLSAVGSDEAGHELLGRLRKLGLNVDHVMRPIDLPTDIYMAVEAQNGLIAAIADAHSLEEAGDQILLPLSDGRLADANKPWTGMAALDGNLTSELLAAIAAGSFLAKADLRIAPASPGKARRLVPFLNHPRATLYVNLEEAGLLVQRDFDTSVDAAQSLVTQGLKRAVVTDGAGAASVATQTDVISATPPAVVVRRITGAGDTFMAAHIAAEIAGLGEQDALTAALNGAADYISSETH